MPEIKQKKAHALELLKIHYGFGKFRPGQEQVIDNILTKKSTVVIMPTGGGKSLCYQLPAMVLDGITIVVSPLISLMKDQVDALEKNGIPAAFINSSITASEAAQRLNAVKQGAVKLLYIAPERFYSQEFLSALQAVKVDLFAIDEAHCISQWGHDFRPSYVRLKDAIALLNAPTVIALTATATPEVKADIIKQLGLQDPQIVITGFARPNLQFGVIQARENEKAALVMDAINSAPDSSGIVYVSTRSRADNLLQYLLENNIEAASYHAGMDSEDRKWVQNNFLANKIKIIIATNAFGLGIDKPDVRFVVHYDMPGTVEAYYQEAGRAGRDGKPSFCLLLYNSRDRALHEFFIKGDNPSPENIMEIYETLLSYESDSVLITYAELGQMLSEKVPDMAIGTILKILEKEGYIARVREKSNNAFLKFLKDFDYIAAALGARAKKQQEILHALKAHYEQIALSGWEINLEEAADILRTKKDALARLLKKLAESGYLEYRPPFKGTEIRILQKLDAKNLKIDKAAMKEKLRRAYDKLDTMEEYIYDLDCRQKFILNYFGDPDARACEKCDTCLSVGGYERKHAAPAKDFSRRTAKSEYEVKDNAEKSGLSTKLSQLETLELHQKGHSISEIAEIRGLTTADIKAHMDFLIKKKILKK